MAHRGPCDRGGLVRLDEDECWRFVARQFLGRIALLHLGAPVIFPVNYALDGHTVAFRAAPGTKLALAEAGARVAFEVDAATPALETGTSVIVHGTLHAATSPEERERFAALPIRTWAPGRRDHVLFVRAEHVSGRSIAAVAHEGVDGG